MSRKEAIYLGIIAIWTLVLPSQAGLGPDVLFAQVAQKRTNQPGTTPPTRGVAPSNSKGATPPANASNRAAPAPQRNNSNQVPIASNVVGVVNGQPLTREELGQECLRRYGKDVLENIINRQLISQACQQRNVVITDQDVEAEIDSIAKKFSLTKDRWIRLLQDEREVSPDQYRHEIIWPTLALRRLAAGNIAVTQDELRRAFESEYGPSVKVRMISLESRKEAERVRALAQKNPENFGELAKDHSKDPNSASARGLIPAIRKHVGDEKVEQVAFKLKKGEISQVIEVSGQFLILKCEEHHPEKYVEGNQVKQVEAQLAEKIRDEKLQKAAADLFRQLQDEAQVVNVLNDPQLQAQNPGVAALINGRPIPLTQLAEDCVMRHGKDVLEGEINRLILNQELQRRGITVQETDIDYEIARAAETYGYMKKGRPDIDGWLKAVTEDDKVSIDLYIRDAVWPSVALKKLVGERVQVSQEDLQKGFEANYGERVEVMAIVLSNQRQAQKVWEMARSNSTDQFFGELAQQYSVEAMSKSNSGRVPPIRKHGGQPIMEDEAFKLKPGELSGIIAMTDKYVILRCLGRTKPVVQDFEAVKEELARDIQEKKVRVEMAKVFDNLKESAHVENRLAGTVKTPQRVADSRGNTAGGLQPASANQPIQGPAQPAAPANRPRINSPIKR